MEPKVQSKNTCVTKKKKQKKKQLAGWRFFFFVTCKLVIPNVSLPCFVLPTVSTDCPLTQVKVNQLHGSKNVPKRQEWTNEQGLRAMEGGYWGGGYLSELESTRVKEKWEAGRKGTKRMRRRRRKEIRGDKFLGVFCAQILFSVVCSVKMLRMRTTDFFM